MLSIITAVLNGERFIEGCIKNVIDQACPDVEHIIIDGSSTDRTVEIIKWYSQRYSHIRWISEKDKGESDALNKGIAMAKGEILGILDYDDFYEPNVLNRVPEIFKTLPEPSLLVGNTNMLDNEGKLTHVTTPKNLNFIKLLSGRWRNTFPCSASSYFYHKSLHQKIGNYKVDEHYMMDVEFILRAVQVAIVKYVDETWANRRCIEGTKTNIHQKSGKQPSHKERLLEEYRKNLSLVQRLQVAIYRSFIYSILELVLISVYIIRHKPQKILRKLKAKIV